MKEKLDSMFLRWKIYIMNTFLRDEEGDTNMVSMIVLIVIVIAVASIFQEQLGNAVKAAFDKLTNFVRES